MRFLLATPLLCALPVAPALAQGLPLVPHVYAGIEAGQGTRHADDRYLSGSVVTDGGGSDKGLDYSVFAGVELPAGPVFYLAAEAGLGKSTAKTDVTLTRGTTVNRVTVDPRWNYTATLRGGVTPIPGLAVYGLAGYGGEKVRVRIADLAAGGTSTSDGRNMEGIIYGFGARYRLTSSLAGGLGLRAEYRHREAKGSYDPEQYLAGVFYRF